jgi:hypothetical protein
MKWDRYVIILEELRTVYKILVGNPEWKRPFRRAGNVTRKL